MDEQRPQLVPEITPQHKKTNHEQYVTDYAKGYTLRFENRD
jgi:hypothetical protein